MDNRSKEKLIIQNKNKKENKHIWDKTRHPSQIRVPRTPAERLGIFPKW